MSDDAAKRCILTVLSDAVVGRINFRIRTVPITPRLLQRVAECVRGRRIAVRHVPGLVKPAIYNSTENRFYLRRDTINTLESQAIIVHEAVHGGCDLMNASQMRVLSSEAAGYLGQCVFARAKTRNPDQERLTHERPTMDRIFEIAWDLAGIVLARRQPSEEQIEALRQAILADPDYHEEGEQLAGYDGVPA